MGDVDKIDDPVRRVAGDISPDFGRSPGQVPELVDHRGDIDEIDTPVGGGTG
jgi:hypothetical protein